MALWHIVWRSGADLGNCLAKNPLNSLPFRNPTKKKQLFHLAQARERIR
jgi:hypothetical protein